MIRGTTPTLKFNLPFNADFISVCYITLSQSGRTVIEKTIDDCTLAGNIIECKLTQKETLYLSDTKDVEIQLRCKTAEGEPLASKIFKCSVERILKEGEI